MTVYPRWTTTLLLATCAQVACSSSDQDDAGQVGRLFPDAELEACVGIALGLADGEIFAEDVLGLTALSCQDGGIVDITGLESVTSLQQLTLWENEVHDLSPLASLSQLHTLQLGNNAIEDLTPLAGLTGLTDLGLGQNAIRDIEPLGELSGLRWLNLDGNHLTTDALAPLCTLQALSWLTLDHNAIDHLDELDCLDAVIYESYQESAQARWSPGPDPLVHAGTPAMDLDLAQLTATTDASGVLALDLTTTTLDVAVISEHGGSLRAVGERVLWDRDDNVVPVGSLVAGELELCLGSYTDRCTARLGLKADGTAHPDLAGGPAAVVTLRLEIADTQPLENDIDLASNTALLDYVLASPNQYDAGSCLFMSNTGAMELLINQRKPIEEVVYKGDGDLSERYLMNASDHVSRGATQYTITDLAYTYDAFGGSLLDRDYPFIADYLSQTSSGGYVEAEPEDSGAFFTCYANWLDDLPEDWQESLTPTSDVERTVIFLDPDLDGNSVWNVGLMDWEVVDRIKRELDSKQAPVILVYNHYIYWHANVIVGYDDNIDSDGCPMVESSLSYYSQQGYGSYVDKIEGRMEELGGCSDRGVFYVRDSIYSGGLTEETYTYSEEYGFSDKYSKRLTQLSYNWAVYLGNHAYSVHRDR